MADVKISDLADLGPVQAGDLIEIERPGDPDQSGHVALGTMASEDASDYTPTSGLAGVATSGDYDDLSNRPTLGGAAALDVGTTAGTVAAGDDSRITGAIQTAGHSALSVIGRSANSTGDAADIAAGSDHQVLRRSGTAIGFGAINLAQSAAVTGILPAANLPDGSTSAAGILELATAAEYRAGTDSARALGVAETWSSAALSQLTDAATITVNLANGFNFGGASNAVLLLGGNRTLGAPSNLKTGQAGMLWFGATGATRTLTLHANWLLMEGVETGPYTITTSQILGVSYVVRGTDAYVIGIFRRAA